MYFYELHEGDDDLMSDVILACETEVPRDEFFDLVRRVHAEVEESFEEDTLVEAIAAELERSHGFVFVRDDRLVGSVRVAADPEGDRLIGALDEADTDEFEDELEDESDESDELDESPDYLTILADYEPDIRRN